MGANSGPRLEGTSKNYPFTPFCGDQESLVEVRFFRGPLATLLCMMACAAIESNVTQQGNAVKELTVREVRANIGRLDELVEEAGEIIISRRGRPIARVLPVTGQRQRPDHADLRQRMAKLVTPSADLLRSERDER